MDSFREFIDRDCEMEIFEAGNISSAMAIKVQNDIVKYGRKAVGVRNLEDKIDALARQNVSIGGLVLMSVAVSGKGSLGSLVAKGLSIRGL